MNVAVTSMAKIHNKSLVMFSDGKYAFDKFLHTRSRNDYIFIKFEGAVLFQCR